MKILVSYLGRRGGVARTAMGLVQALSKTEGVEVAYIASSRSEFIDDLRRIRPIRERLEIDTFSSKPEFFLKSLLLPMVHRKVGRLVDRFRPDIVIAPGRHHWNPFLLRRLVSHGASYVPIIHDARTHPGERYPYPVAFQRFELDRSVRIVALSDKVKRDLMDLFSLSPDSIAVCELPPVSKPDANVRPDSIERKPFTFLFYGRILAYKGLDVLIEAFSSLLPAHPDIKLIIAGQGELPAGTQELVDSGKVTLINRWISEDEISKIFCSAHAVVLPYREASQSGVVVDAIANLRPVIATRVGALPEQVGKYGVGLLSESATPALVAVAMEEIMRPEVYERLVRNVTQASKKNDMWSPYVEVMRDVASGSGGRGGCRAAKTGPRPRG